MIAPDGEKAFPKLRRRALEIVGLVDVQPQKQLGKGSIALAKDLNINANAKTGHRTRQIVVYVFFAGCSLSGQ
jgi:hypothetical protein